MLAQAASHGLGVALIPPFLIERELADGHLAIAHDQSVPSDNGYYLIVPERKVESAALRAFRDWLLAAARTYQPEIAAKPMAQ
jgi:DNA-binding transcriptional LysR family regulator